MSKTKEYLNQLTEEQLIDLQILYEVIGPECDNSL
jgi:hypothetical protein